MGADLNFRVSIIVGADCEIAAWRFVTKSVPAAKDIAEGVFDQTARADVFARLVQMTPAGKPVARWEGCESTHAGEAVFVWNQSTPAAWKAQGVCPVCRGTFALTSRGTLAPHRRADGKTVRTLQGARVPAPCDGAAMPALPDDRA
jgi:hypothetical protein